MSNFKNVMNMDGITFEINIVIDHRGFIRVKCVCQSFFPFFRKLLSYDSFKKQMLYK